MKIMCIKIFHSIAILQRNKISDAIDEIQKKTCVRFVPVAGNEKNFVIFKNDQSGCWSNVGMIGGSQDINLEDPCFKKSGTIQHEILHAVGFYHEQNRADRDRYVEILKSNVDSGNFNLIF